MEPHDGTFDPENPSPASNEFSPFDTDWNQEFVAGWLDGFRASKAAILNVARAELNRYGLSVDREGGVDELTSTEAAIPGPFLGPRPDNPDANSAYDEGWDAGYDEGHQTVIRGLREQLVQRNLFVTDMGSVTTIDVASELVDYCRDLVENRGGVRVSDQEIHAFIDGSPATIGETAELTEILDPTPAQEPEPLRQQSPARKNWLQRFWGVMNMVRREIDRRTALVAMGSVLMTTSLGYLVVKDHLVPAEVRTQGAYEEPLYTAPSTWDGMLPGARSQFLAWDQLVWQTEEAGNTAALAVAVANIMRSPGMDDLKMNMATFVRTSGRTELLNALLFGLHPAISSATTRRTVLDAIQRLNLDGSLNPIPAYLGNGLMTYQNANIETDQGCLQALTDLITIFQTQ